MVRLVIALCIVLFPVSILPAYVIPVLNRSDLSSEPFFVIFTEGNSKYMELHAALYEDGTLIWSEGYKSFGTGREPLQNADGVSTCTLFRYRLSATEVAEVRGQVLARKSVAAYGERGYKVQPDRPFQVILYRSTGEHFQLQSGHETSVIAILSREAYPNATPTPVPPSALPFVEDWNFLKDVLFGLVDEHKQQAENLGPVVMHQEFVSD